MNPCRRTDWNHRSGGRAVTRLGGYTTTCTQCYIVLRFSCQESDFKNDVEIDSQHRHNSSSSDPICKCDKLFGAEDVVGGQCTALRYMTYTTTTCISTLSFVILDEIPKDCMLQAGHWEQSLSLQSLNPVSFNRPIMEVMVVKLLDSGI